MKIRFSEKQLLLMTIGFFFVVAVPLALIGYFWLHKSLGVVKTQITQVEDEIKQAEIKLEQQNQLDEQKKQLQCGLEIAKEILPSKEEVSYENFIELLGRLKREANVELYKVQLVKDARRQAPGAGTSEAFEKVSYDLKAEGAFYDLITFVYSLENYKRFIKVDKFDFSTSTSGDKIEGGTLRHGLNLTLSTYTFK
jgi:Tfp pilus assembly protein PilO